MITKTFETDQEAQVLLKEKLPSNWLFREQKPDIHIDYFIEIVEDSFPSGILFAVQLKGTRQLYIQRGLIKIQFKVNQLIYYIDKVRIPVYLIIGDVTNKKCYWLFLQEYIKNEFKSDSWRKNKKVTIKLPEANLLSDIDLFRNHIKESEKYIRDLFPSSIPAAIYAQQEHWKKLDSRIEVDIYHSGSNTSFKLKPKEKINFSFFIKKGKSPEFQKKIEEAFNKGSAAEFDSSDFEIKGSDLISELINTSNAQGKFTIKPAPWLKGSVIFETITKDEKTSSFIYNINGKIFWGKNEFTFDGELENAPLKINMSAPINPIDGKIIANVSMDFTLDKWANKPIVFLPYRERLYSLFYDLVSGLNLIVHLDLEGNNLYKTTKIFDVNENILSVFNFFKLVHQAAKIAEYLKVNLILPEKGKISGDDWDTADILYSVITEGEYRKNAEKTKFSISLLPNEETISKIMAGNKFDGALRLITNKHFILFGQNVDL